MRIAAISSSCPHFGARDALKGIIYARPVKTDPAQRGIIDEALDELEDVEFNKTDVMYMRSLGITPAFNDGEEIVDFLEENEIPIQYGRFSDKDVHACLARGEEEGTRTVLINERYKNASSKPEILATAEAIAHEAGHAKDNDTSNSIQEELDNLALNVLVHRGFENKYPGIYQGQNSFLFREGVNLYPKLFFEFGADKTGLKDRVSEKYGHMKAGDDKHPASKMANEIKQLDLIA